MNNKLIIKKGKHLSFLLRHDKDYKFDNHGYRDISDLVNNHGYTKEEIDIIVSTNDKKRYEYNIDKTKIRARQGHSIPINVDLKKEAPPNVLYHGTSTAFLDSIYRNGIKKMSRNFVHLSNNMITAKNIGKRHGKPVILKIDSDKMNRDGIIFYHSNNDVWLTEYISPKYIIESIYI